MISNNSDNATTTAQNVDKICSYFLGPRKLSYFHFKRAYQDNTFITLTNNAEFFIEYLEDGYIESTIYIPNNTLQISFSYWDEALPKLLLSSLREKQRVYHGITIINRRKSFYDCTTFAMSEVHPSPISYYFHILKELQNFSEVFPKNAHHIIQKSTKKAIKSSASSKWKNRKSFFIPKRSTRFQIGGDTNNYITTYEALCMQLVQEGKSFKEIGAILSMESSTVKTHLLRLKARTGLSLQEIALQSFQPLTKRIRTSELGKYIEQSGYNTKESK